MSTLWSGRFTSAPDTEVFEYGKSLAVDRRLRRRRHHRQPGVGRGARPRRRAARRRMSRAIVARTRRDPGRGATPIRALIEHATDEDVHSFVERELIARIGDAGRRLHTGRSRNEQVSRRFPAVPPAADPRGSDARSRLLVEALAHQAESAGQAVMPSYTHLRRAQPVLVAHVWLSHAAAFRRDVDRFETARHEADVMPLGSGAIAGTAYDDRRASGWPSRLGFSRMSPNSIDTSGDRDFVASFLFACSMAMVHLSRLAEDVILFSSEEFGFSRGPRLGRHRIEPDAAEEESGSARARARQVGKGHRSAHRLADDDERPAARLQQGSAGGQGGRLRGRGPHDRVRAHDGDGHPNAHAAARASPAPPRPVCCSPPRSPTISSRAACRSGPRTRSPAASCVTSTRAAGLQSAHARRLAQVSRALRRGRGFASSRPKRQSPPRKRRSPPPRRRRRGAGRDEGVAQDDGRTKAFT